MALKSYPYTNLGKNIQSLRKAYGETQQDLANILGLGSPSVISQYESGERMPKPDCLFRIAKHYRITETELLRGNFENMSDLTQLPLSEQDLGAAMLTKMFPLICSPKGLENPKFKEAYSIHTRLLEELRTEDDFESDKIETCLELYKEARRERLVDAAANHLWWLMFLGFALVACTPHFMDYLDVMSDFKISGKELFGAFLPSFGEEVSKEEFDTEQNRAAFLEEYGKELWGDIALLRSSKEYSDLGDYYLALCYELNLLRNDHSAEMNKVIGSELLLTFSVMGNKYCKAFLNATKEH